MEINSLQLNNLRRLSEISSFLSEPIAIEALKYTLTVEDFERKVARDLPVVSPGHVTGVSLLHDNEARISFSSGISLRVRAFERGMRLTWVESKIDTGISDRLLKPAKLVQEGSGPVVLSNGSFKLKVEDDGTIHYLLGEREFRRDDPPEFVGDGFRQASSIEESARIHGTGERAMNYDLRGSLLKMWNHDANGSYGSFEDPLYISIPVYIVEGEVTYLVFHNNPSQGEIDMDFNHQGMIRARFSGCGHDMFIFPGSLKEVLRCLRDISGPQSLPPRWALGFHQSRYSYMNGDEVMSVARGFKDNGLPISAIHLDIDYMDGYRVFTVDRNRFVDLAGMNRDLASMGIRTVAIIDPGVKVDDNYSVYREGLRRDAYVKWPDGTYVNSPVWPGNVAFPDFTEEKVRDWWGSNYEFFEENGISGIWHDMNEPAVFPVRGDNSLPWFADHHGRLHRDVHNIYAMHMARAAYEYMVKRRGERPFILSRSGWAGIQKYSAVWTGDTESTWDALRITIPTILNLGLSGIPFAGVDVGGFSGSPSDELFVRWFQMATFLPLFRVHSSKGSRPREPWHFPRHLEILRKYLRVRYSLIDHIMTLFYITRDTGLPIVRPVSMEFPGEEVLDDVAFMLGDSILVVPVLQPGQRYRYTKLPGKGHWYSFWNGERVSGIVEERISIQDIPVYVREGSIIPVRDGERLRLHVYTESVAEGSLYMDDDAVDPRYAFWTFRFRVDGNSVEYSVFKEGQLDTDNEFVCVLHMTSSEGRPVTREFEVTGRQGGLTLS